MRLAIDCRYIQRARPSGIGGYVRALVDRLPRAAGTEFVLWAHRRAPRPLSRAPNVQETTVAPGPNSALAILCPDWHASFRGVDLFHNPHNVLPRRVPCPTVVTVHDVLALDLPRLHRRGLERVRGLYYPQAILRALRDATRLIVPSRATADRVLAWAPEAAARLRVIPMAAGAVFRPADDPARVRERARALVGADAPFVLVVGENSANKSHVTALGAFARAAPASWKLVMLQRRGSPRRLQRAAARAGLAGRVVWLRGIAEEDVATLMQAAVILIQPSRYEGFGLPVLEAMACGCPVIASDIPALREVAGEAAILVSPGDVGAFATAVRRMSGSADERSTRAAAGLERALGFSWNRTVHETLAVYDEALRR